MTDAQILKHLRAGRTLNFGVNGRNTEVMAFMAELEEQGLIKTRDMGLSQETRREARWIGEDLPYNELEEL
mgnify:CR=1 FL=1